jgi:HlyD family secretion protein
MLMMMKPLHTRNARNARITLSVALGVILLTACANPFNQTQSAEPQRSATLSKGTLVATVSATGNIQPEATVNLVFQATGKVAEVKVTRGDAVKKGDLLARLDDADLQTALEQAQAALVIASAAYSRTVQGPRAADITAAQAALNAATANYNKQRAGPDKADIAAAEAAVRNAEAAVRQAQAANDLAYKFDPQHYPGSPTIVQLQQVQNNLEAARLQYDRTLRGADKAQLAAALQQVQDARARLEKLQQAVHPYDIDQATAEREKATLQVQQAQRRLDQARLTAPRDGVIAAVNVKVGEDALGQAGQPTFVLVDMSVLHIDITVDEIDVAKVRTGQAVSVTLDALPGVELQGTVERVASTSSLVNGVVSYSVRVVITRTDAPLRVGMTANASIVLDKREGVLLAPNWAVRRDRQSGQSFLTLRVDDKTTRELEVKTGLRNENVSEILSGADEGQVVVAPVAPSLLGQ